jgi:hypothetical protein
MIRRPGRPPLDEADPSVEMCLTIPSKRYDDLYARARAERVTVPEVIRRVLTQQLQKNIETSSSKKPR